MQKYAKFLVAIGGFLVILGGQLAGVNSSGDVLGIDFAALYNAGVSLLTALGVYQARNKPESA